MREIRFQSLIYIECHFTECMFRGEQTKETITRTAFSVWIKVDDSFSSCLTLFSTSAKRGYIRQEGGGRRKERGGEEETRKENRREQKGTRKPSLVPQRGHLQRYSKRKNTNKTSLLKVCIKYRDINN